MLRLARSVVLFSAVAFLSAFALPGFAALAPGSEAAEATLFTLVNGERTGRGMRALAEGGDLTVVARRQAAQMAAANRLYHNPSLQQDVQNWQLVGENVGRGPSAEKIHQAFMASPTHRAEILQARFSELGVGAVTEGGILWVSQVFRQPLAPAAAPAPTAAAPVAATVPEPAAVPARPPAPAPAAASTTVPAPARARPPLQRAVAAAAPVTTAPPPTDPLVEALAAALEAAAGSRPEGVGDARGSRLRRAGSVATAPSLPPLPVTFAGGLLLAVVAAQVRTTQRLRAATA